MGEIADSIVNSMADEGVFVPPGIRPVKCGCGAPLVERKGKFGRFLGCSNWPKCKVKTTYSLEPK